MRALSVGLNARASALVKSASAKTRSKAAERRAWFMIDDPFWRRRTARAQQAADLCSLLGKALSLEGGDVLVEPRHRHIRAPGGRGNDDPELLLEREREFVERE